MTVSAFSSLLKTWEVPYQEETKYSLTPVTDILVYLSVDILKNHFTIHKTSTLLRLENTNAHRVLFQHALTLIQIDIYKTLIIPFSSVSYFEGMNWQAAVDIREEVSVSYDWCGLYPLQIITFITERDRFVGEMLPKELVFTCFCFLLQIFCLFVCLRSSEVKV